MFRIKSTGVNNNYGKKGEIKLLSDNYVLNAIKMGWIENHIEFVGNRSWNRPIKYDPHIITTKQMSILKTKEGEK